MPCSIFIVHTTSMSVFFSFSCSGDHRDLHSFPTRRSSDLSLPGPAREIILELRHVLPDALQLLVDDRDPLRLEQETGGSRSEEHTSELQSQFHLVCRLLLEKKKKKNINNNTNLHTLNIHFY